MKTSRAAPTDQIKLIRIQEAAAQVGLTTRSIRYYEAIGLLAPAARSDGAYRLYDDHDIERLTFIKGLRDDAGFSLAEIAQLLEDKQARRRNREQLRVTADPADRAAIMTESIARLDRQIGTLQTKIERLAAMVLGAEGRRAGLVEQRAELLAEASPDGSRPKPTPDKAPPKEAPSEAPPE